MQIEMRNSELRIDANQDSDLTAHVVVDPASFNLSLILYSPRGDCYGQLTKLAITLTHDQAAMVAAKLPHRQST